MRAKVASTIALVAVALSGVGYLAVAGTSRTGGQPSASAGVAPAPEAPQALPEPVISAPVAPSRVEPIPSPTDALDPNDWRPARDPIADEPSATSFDGQSAPPSPGMAGIPEGSRVSPVGPDPEEVWKALDQFETIAKASERKALVGGPLVTDVVLTYAVWSTTAGAVQAAGYAGSLDPGGTCELLLTKAGAQPVSAVAQAVPDAKSATCSGLEIARADIPAGVWTARINYYSSVSNGTSNTMEVRVP